MRDIRIDKLAKILINFSCDLQAGEKIMIESIGQNDELVRALVEEAYAAGGLPFIKMDDSKNRRALMMGLTEEQADLMAKIDSAMMSEMQAYIGVRGGDNISETSDVPAEKTQLYQKRYWHPVHSRIRVPKTKWCVLRYPTSGMAQLAKMSTEAFEDFYFEVCTLDYGKMGRAMQPLKELMERTDRVRLLGPGETDLTFSIKGIPAIPCDGHMNIPDGEIYTAPVRESVNGVICYNAPSPHDGFTYENVRLVFKDGKIVEASANNSELLNKVLDVDEGARYVGEFAIGVHPYITKPMGDILFDEKICGSIHFTPGMCYDEASNGNVSVLHWDLVMIQTPEYGGGEIYFDDVLIRKDGRFVIPELECLNPENLK